MYSFFLSERQLYKVMPLTLYQHPLKLSGLRLNQLTRSLALGVILLLTWRLSVEEVSHLLLVCLLRFRRALSTRLPGGLGATRLVQAATLAFPYTSLLFLMVPIVTPLPTVVPPLAHHQNQDESTTVWFALRMKLLLPWFHVATTSSAWNVPTRSVKREHRHVQFARQLLLRQSKFTLNYIYIYIYTHIYIYIHKYYISMWTHKGMDIMVPPVNFLMISYDCYQALLGLG